jgi:hypothetical protein
MKLFFFIFLILSQSIAITINAQNINCININASDQKIGDIDVALDDGDCITNYLSWHEFVALSWTSGGVPIFDRSLIKFNISIIPSLATIDSAILTLHKHPAPTSANGQAFNGDCSFYLQEVIEDWIPNTVTWCDQPNINLNNQILIPCNSFINQNMVKIDLTNMLSNMHNQGLNYGFKIRMVNEQPFNSATFVSSNFPQPSMWPDLKICYSLPVGQLDLSRKLKYTLITGENSTRLVVNLSTPMLLKIYDSNGRIVLQDEFINLYEISRDRLKAGFYIIEINDPASNIKEIIKLLH